MARLRPARTRSVASFDSASSEADCDQPCHASFPYPPFAAGAASSGQAKAALLNKMLEQGKGTFGSTCQG
eukprot:1723912-Alexandrium_andersonii.AAC.1